MNIKVIKKQLISLYLATIFFIISAPAFAINPNSGFDNDNASIIFADKFKKAVTDDDRKIVASMIFYPIEATLNSKAVIINNEREFIKLYNDIFDKNLCNKIANSDTHNMLSNYQGVMLGDGEVWFSMENGNIKVVAVGVCRRYYPDIK